MTESSFQIPKRTVTLVSSALLALAGTATLATGWTAQATPGSPHQVWVCKFVDKPHEREVLKSGKNPIFVDWASLTGKSSAPHIGDTFSDAQVKSVVVQIGGPDPGIKACVASPPPTTTTTPPPTTTTTPPPTTTTAPPTTGTTTTPPPTTGMTSTPPPTTTSSSPPPTTPSGGGGETPGTGAPGTGGAGGGTSPLNDIVGSGLLLAAAALVTGDVLRRRRQANGG
jgi:hypothetical protein